MGRLEDLRPNTSVRGILSDCLVTVVSVEWFGAGALELTYKDPQGRVLNQLLYRQDEPRLEVVEQGRPWAFDGNGALFRLVSEAHRIRLAYVGRRRQRIGQEHALPRLAQWDAAALLRLMWEGWNDVFRKSVGNAEMA